MPQARFAHDQLFVANETGENPKQGRGVVALSFDFQVRPVVVEPVLDEGEDIVEFFCKASDFTSSSFINSERLSLLFSQYSTGGSRSG